MSAIGPLAVLPLFWRTQGRRCIIVGGGAGAAWKAELLAAAGAEVHVFAPAPEAVFDPRATLHRRDWTPADLAGAALIIAESGEGGLLAAARAAGAPISLIDAPTDSDFQFGTIVNRSPVVIGISSGGGAPVLAQAIRRRIEAILPASVAQWAAAALAYRPRAKALLPRAAQRRCFWERLADAALRPGAPGPATLDHLTRSTPTASGEITLVGAGPGGAEWLTLAAVRALQAADVVVHDRLIGPDVLEMARREARRIAVGKAGYGAATPQSEIDALIVALALEGKRVVRLKGGDPAIFARTAEEVAAAHAAGVPITIVPGVTAASAAAAALGLSLSHRDLAARVQFVTAHAKDGVLAPGVDLAALADPQATTIVYMAGRTAPTLAQALIARGLPADTPAAVAIAVGWPEASHHRTTLAALAAGGPIAADGLPVLLLIGRALGIAVNDAARVAA